MQGEGKRPKKKPRGFTAVDGALVAVMLGWGANMVAVKTALAEMSPLAFNSLRFLIASAVMFFLLWLTEDDLSVSAGELRWLIWTGLVGNTVYQVLFINGINLSSAGNTAFMVATAPVWVAVLSAAFSLESIRARQWLGVFASVSGVILVITGGGGSIVFSRGTFSGDLLTLAGALCWATYTIMTRPILANHSPLKVTTYAMIAGTVPLTLLSIPALRAQDWGVVSPTGWALLLYGALVALVFGYVVWSWGVKSIGSTRTAIYNNLTPVVAAVLGYLWLSESWTFLKGVGALAIVVGLYVVRTGGGSRPAPGRDASRSGS